MYTKRRSCQTIHLKDIEGIQNVNIDKPEDCLQLANKMDDCNFLEFNTDSRQCRCCKVMDRSGSMDAEGTTHQNGPLMND